MAFEHLKVARLTKVELDAALECQEQLKTLKFIHMNGYDVCDESEDLLRVSDTFIKRFNPWSKVCLKKRKDKIRTNERVS